MDFELLDDFEPAEEIIDVAQAKLDAWHQQRCGRFTCSRFGELMTTGRSKSEPWGQTALSYIFQVAAERAGSSQSVSSYAMDWGTEMEPFAIDAYMERFPGRVVDYDSHRFVELDSITGGSPDAIVDSDGVLEVKCPFSPAVHMRTAFDRLVPKEYFWQVQGHLLITGRQWCDFASFDPRINAGYKALRLIVIRVVRNEKALAELNQRLTLAAAKLIEVENQIRDHDLPKVAGGMLFETAAGIGK